ncbi:MAG: hypothetical protein OSJ27_10595, partial [Candidatus Gastranaerophilales bacterium]|nr:hypothetical protein [Candidatus Gastranaerophilales bacterium]
NGVTFNKAVTLKLGKPEYVQLLINAETKQVVLQACSEDTQRATIFYKPKKNAVFSVRWNARDLVSTFQRLLDAELVKQSFRVNGELVDERTMLFDLNAAIPLV